MADSKIRCLLGMLGTDVHSKGIRTLAQLLRDLGIEVIYLGEHNTPEGFVNAIIAEDVDVVGLSYSTATYMHYTSDLIRRMREANLDNVAVMVGGLIHPADESELRRMGVKGIFGAGSTTREIVDFLVNVTGKPLDNLSGIP